MVGVLVGLQHHVGDVGQICSPGLLVDRADVHAALMLLGAVLRRDVDDGHGLEEHLGPRLHQLAAPAVPSGTLQVEAVHVHALTGRLRDVVLHQFEDIVPQDDGVQSPALVCSRHLLK